MISLTLSKDFHLARMKFCKLMNNANCFLQNNIINNPVHSKIKILKLVRILVYYNIIRSVFHLIYFLVIFKIFQIKRKFVVEINIYLSVYSKESLCHILNKGKYLVTQERMQNYLAVIIVPPS